VVALVKDVLVVLTLALSLEQKTKGPTRQSDVQISERRDVDDPGVKDQEGVLGDHVDVIPIGIFRQRHVGRRWEFVVLYQTAFTQFQIAGPPNASYLPADVGTTRMTDRRIAGIKHHNVLLLRLFDV